MNDVSDVFIVSFEQISCIIPVFLLLTLKKYLIIRSFEAVYRTKLDPLLQFMQHFMLVF